MRVALVLLLACGLYGDVTESKWRLRKAMQDLDRGNRILDRTYGYTPYAAEYRTLRKLYEAQQERLAADPANRK